MRDRYTIKAVCTGETTSVISPLAWSAGEPIKRTLRERIKGVLSKLGEALQEKPETWVGLPICRMYAGTFRCVKAGVPRLGTAATKQASSDVRAFCRTEFAHSDGEFSSFPLP